MSSTDVELDGARPVRPTRVDSRRLLRVLPFAVVAVAGQLSALLDPTNMAYFWLSASGLVVVAAVLLLPQRSYSLGVAAAVYVASVAALMIANGGVTNSGLGSLFFLAVVAAALYGDRRDSAVVVALVMGFLLVVTLTSPHTAASTARRLVFLGSIAVVLSVSIHALRARLEASNRHTKVLLQQSEAMYAAARRLALLQEPATVAEAGVALAVQLTSPLEGDRAEAWYVVAQHEAFETVASAGGAVGRTVNARRPLPDAMIVAEVARTGRAISQRLPHSDGSRARWGNGVPVRLRDEVHGVLVVVVSQAKPTDLLDQLTALAHLMEMALANWVAHQELERQATSEERRRVARDLHDGLAHELAFIASKARRTGAPPELQEVSGAADRALDEARRAITVLSSTRPQPLATALAQTAEDLGGRLGIPVLVDLDERIDVAPDVAEQLLRIAREGLTNAAVHGTPNYVIVSLRDNVTQHQLVIADDGCGFDPDRVDPSRFGLVSMRERAASIGGFLSITSAPGSGTRVEVTFR